MPDIVTSQVFSDAEKGITATKMNNIVSQSVIQTDFYNNKASSSTLDPTDTFLELKSSGSYAQITGSNLITSVSSQVNVTPQIWSTRLRSFSAVGNGNFEVDQRNVGNAITAAAGTNNAFVVDRWSYGKIAATGVCSLQQTPFNTLVPGTSFQISKRLLRVTLTTAQGTLGAGEYLAIYQTVEGINWRELIADVHSISLLVQSSVAGLKFAVSLNDNPTVTQSIVYICTIPSANTPTLITLPAIPVWPAGNFAWGSGSVGYRIQICLACGTTYTAPATGTWQSGNYFGASGMSNFLGSPTSSTFDLMAIQHEPGSQSTTLIDKPFSQNYDECLRYYAKSYEYSLVKGSSSSAGIISFATGSNTSWALGPLRFPKIMAKDPTVQIWAADGTVNAASMLGGSNVTGLTTFSGIGQTGFNGFNGVLTANSIYQCHYTADTGL